MSDVREVLVKARELIADPRRWTQESAARDKQGRPVPGLDETAVCWCAVGAIYHVADRHIASYARNSLVRVTPGGDVFEFNDTHTHAEVLAAFDRAIASASPAITQQEKGQP